MLWETHFVCKKIEENPKMWWENKSPKKKGKRKIKGKYKSKEKRENKSPKKREIEVQREKGK